MNIKNQKLTNYDLKVIIIPKSMAFFCHCGISLFNSKTLLQIRLLLLPSLHIFHKFFLSDLTTISVFSFISLLFLCWFYENDGIEIGIYRRREKEVVWTPLLKTGDCDVYWCNPIRSECLTRVWVVILSEEGG